MKRHPSLTVSSCLALAVLGASSIAAAQGEPPPAAPGGGADQGPSPGGPNVTVVTLPPAAQTYPGALPPPTFDPNANLPSSARPTLDASRSTDGFDLGGKGGGPTSVRGSSSASYVVEGANVPEAHTVRRGETLWEVSGHFYLNPYRWPQLWAENPQIQNPHWIYPGDRLRLREPGAQNARGFSLHRRAVPSGTVFLREVGWVDTKSETWGEVIGSPVDFMLLGDGNELYLQIQDGRDVQIGQDLTLFAPIRDVSTDNASGTLVAIRGTARVDRYNPRTHVARAQIVECLDVIERGIQVGPVGRRFDVVAPVVSQIDLDANILASVYPAQVFGQNQIVFLDRGDKEGVKAGMRFFLVRRGDRWQKSIRFAGKLASVRGRTEDDRPAEVEDMRTDINDDLLPEETYGEVRIISTHDHTSAALVIQARHEIERTARLVARKGL